MISIYSRWNNVRNDFSPIVYQTDLTLAGTVLTNWFIKPSCFPCSGSRKVSSWRLDFPIRRILTPTHVFAENQHEGYAKEIGQTGGVGIVTTDNVTHRITSRGRDDSKLGRWSWICLEGKQHHRTRVLTGYRPCEGGTGVGSAYIQHERYLQSKKRDISPREAFYEDLAPLLNEWKAQGDHIIITLDANEDVRTGATASFFNKFDMKECILHRHRRMSPPATNNKNQQRQPIDGIWTTAGIQVKKCGYLPFGKGCPKTDQPALWADFTR